MWENRWVIIDLLGKGAGSGTWRYRFGLRRRESMPGRKPDALKMGLYFGPSIRKKVWGEFERLGPLSGRHRSREGDRQ
jgi:hypothetical protein